MPALSLEGGRGDLGLIPELPLKGSDRGRGRVSEIQKEREREREREREGESGR